MALKIYSSVCYRYFCFVSQPPKETAVDFLKSIRFNYYPVRWCQTKPYCCDISLLETKIIKNYFEFIQTDSSYIRSLNHKHKEQVKNVLALLEHKKKIEFEIIELEKIPTSQDKELEKLVSEEKENYFKDIENINNELLENILPVNEDDNDRTVEIQIIPAIGGDEARLFGENLYKMYLQYADYKNWNVEMSEFKDLGTSSIVVSGETTFNYLKYEAGVHRVQRVPETERFGRTHTSTCSIAILPFPKSHEFVLNEKDLKIEAVKSSGPGGQHINKSETGIRIKHLPTGVVVSCQSSRFQHNNRATAMERLRCMLFNMEIDKQCSEKLTLKKSQVGSNEYSRKIRTYNFNQNRVTDHRINYSMNDLKGFLTGKKELDLMIEKVKNYEKVKSLLDHISQVVKDS